MPNYLTAIIYTNVPQPVTNNQFLKYRNIKDTDEAKARFMVFAAKFPGAEHVNWYNSKTRAFIERIYLQ